MLKPRDIDMPLKYPPEWKFDGFVHKMPIEAHREFVKLIGSMVRGTDSAREVYEEFKEAFGWSGPSTDTGWAETDMNTAMRGEMDNAVLYVVSFYAGMKAVEERRIDVPPVKKLNQILSDHDVPLIIEPPHLLLREGDIDFVPEDVREEALSAAFVQGPEIGYGTFGRVYKVTRKTRVGEYALAMKILQPSALIENKERARKRFEREVRTLEKLQHRAIIPMLEAGLTADQVPYILMPFIDGKDVRTALLGATPEPIYDTFIEIARGLEFAHKKGAIHRDLKPNNILVRSADKQPFILDFGCAYLIDEVDENMTSNFLGTPGYVPEEVLNDPKLRDPRQDIYACGVMLYEVIMSERPRPERYKPIVKVRPEFKGVDDVIKQLIAPFEERISGAGFIHRQLNKLMSS